MKINFLKISLLLISFSLMLNACKTTKRIEIHRTESMKKHLVLQKFPCFGQCQEYKISSYDDGILILEGKNNVEKKGVYFTQINAVQLSSLKNKAASIMAATPLLSSAPSNVKPLAVITPLFKCSFK